MVDCDEEDFNRGYPSHDYAHESVSLTCRYDFTTLKELEMESEITEAQKPMKAKRASHTIRGWRGGSVRTSERKLY